MLLRFLSTCRPWVWSAGRPCALVRVCLPVVVTLDAGGLQRGGVWRTGPAASPPPRVPRLSWGGREPPLASGGVGGRRPLGPPPVSRGLEGGRGGERGREGGLAPWFLANPLRFTSPDPRQLRRLACSPRLRPPAMAGGVAPRVPPCRVLRRGCLAAPGAGRGLAGRQWVSLGGGGGGGRCAAPIGGSAWGSLGAGGGGSLCLGLSLCLPRTGIKAGRSGLALSLEGRPPYCTDSRACAAARMRSAGCHCAPAQGCWPAAVLVGVGGQRTGAARRTGPVAPLPRCRRPLERGWVSHGPAGGVAGPPLGGGGEGGGLPAVHLRSPGTALRWPQGGSLTVSAPGGQPLSGGGPLLFCSPRTHRALGCCARITHGPSRRRRLAAWHRRGGEGGVRRALGVAVRVSA